MRDEVHKRRARQRDMPFLSTPTQTSYARGGDEMNDASSAVTLAADEANTTPFALDTNFLLGIDTCGFTTSSTITCDLGYECTNVDSHRGCCVAGGLDCASTIHTECLDYTLMPNAAMCGPHTLCCPATKAHCFTYAFTTEDNRGATFTHVQCAESAGFGELYPYPPESITATGNTDAEASSSTLLSIQPVNTNKSTSSHSVSTAAVAGGAIGAILIAALVIAGIVLLIKRRRQCQKHQFDTEGPDKATGAANEDTNLRDGFGVGRQRQRPLSIIPEQASPQTLSPGAEQHATGSPRRPTSFGPNWPLNTRSPNAINPLTSHPTDVEKRLSGHDVHSKAASHEESVPKIPVIKIPTPLPKREVSVSAGGSALQSPRLSYIPVSPIDRAFGLDVEKRLSSVGRQGAHDITNNLASPRPFVTVNTSVPGALIANGEAKERKASIEARNFSSSRRSSRLENEAEPVSPVSPLDDDDETSVQRISLVSAASGPNNHINDKLNEFVSPISPNDGGAADGEVSPLSVSPQESRRGSLD
ncbi:hypothetical protein GGR57DRAFT_518257 [Xylariaceae sp. FL1272]|nr:hypothetical protein GGR57DRAFT_518257 [Xylariaceae sp. FL1272]